MKYLTQATYHSPGSKAERTPAVVTDRGPNCSDGNASSAGLALNKAAAEALESPGLLPTAARLHLMLMVTDVEVINNNMYMTSFTIQGLNVIQRHRF